MEPDFGGYATKTGLKCTDGRTIMPDAFKHMDKMTVPLVWQHGHDSPNNVLGHVVLESRSDGVYCRGFFNDTEAGINSKKLVRHGDIKSLSIYANKLVERASQVFHGMIREVSLVLSGANPKAEIDFVSVQHDDGEIQKLEDEAIIRMKIALEHTGLDEEDKKDEKEDVEEGSLSHTTVREVYDTFTSEQKDVVHFMIGAALEEQSKNAEHSDNNEDGLTHQEGNTDMGTRNVFDQTGVDKKDKQHTLSHSDLQGIMQNAQKTGSLKAAFEDYALKHGINDIDVLFPEARNLTNTPEFIKRETEWVQGVLNGTRKSPFSRVKTIFADITQEDARAKGYIKGEYKKEEWFGLTKRTTGPTTIYKKQKLDRDDIIDITDLDVVMWMKGEMQLMLKEELAGAILIGDGRAVDDEDKIKDPIGATEGTGIRSILHDHELFVSTINVNLDDSNSSMLEVVDTLIKNRSLFKGTGIPNFYTTEVWLAKFLVVRESSTGKRLWPTVADLAAELRVKDIITVEVMERETDLVGIIVNLDDYNIGADKGGEVAFFDDFDIDYNQYKYLYETRLSGALTKYKSALIIKTTTSTNVLVDPVTSPTFVRATGVVTIPTQTGVVYKNADTSATLSAGAQTALEAGATLNVKAFPASGYYFETNARDEWSFTRPTA